MRTLLSLTLAAVSLALASGCASAPDDASQAADDSAGDELLSNAAGAISVDGNHLTRDGKRWLPKGFSMIGALTHNAAVAAYAHWGGAELHAAKSWGADALRFQVSEPALDPEDAEYRPHYIQRLRSMVSLAEKHGFAVVLSMQDQKLSGGDSEAMPSYKTLRAWQALAPVFASDRSVVYELFNEPHNKPDAAGWGKWKDGTETDVGHQRLLDTVRSLGAQNVVFVDGGLWAQTLEGVPELKDALGRVVYAAHPYSVDKITTDPKAWDHRFGDLAARVPVVVSEWNDTTRFQPGGCQPNARRFAPELVHYLHRHDIGIFGWAFDRPGTLVKNWNWEPTNLDGFNCGSGRPEDGAGALLKRTFLGG